MDHYLKRPRFWFSERQVGRFFEEEGQTSVSVKLKTLGNCIGRKTRNAQPRLQVVLENLFKRVVLSQSHVPQMNTLFVVVIENNTFMSRLQSRTNAHQSFHIFLTCTRNLRFKSSYVSSFSTLTSG